MRTIAVHLTRTEGTTLYFQTSLEDDDNIKEAIEEHINALEDNVKRWDRIGIEWEIEILDDDETPSTISSFAELIGETKT